jgi:DMSO/TMAO reductase YedYZ molybdopterin-dependent catalytic subunit
MVLPQIVSVSDFHCVEGWSVLTCHWEGVSFNSLMDRVKPSSRNVWFECADGYTTTLPLKDLTHKGVIFAHKLNGEDLLPSLGAQSG